MALIYTHNSSPRRYKKVVKSKSWYKAKEEQNKLLRSMGIDPNRRLRQPRMTVPLDQVGKLQTFSNNIKVENAPATESRNEMKDPYQIWLENAKIERQLG